jgi:hypothetical protein
MSVGQSKGIRARQGKMERAIWKSARSLSKPCPIVVCQSPGCHWRGQMPSGRRPGCPHCLKRLA